jgi:hypothetical protein
MAAARCSISTLITTNGITAAAHGSHQGSMMEAALNSCGKITGHMVAAHNSSSSSSGTLMAAAQSAVAQGSLAITTPPAAGLMPMTASSSRPVLGKASQFLQGAV